MKIIYEILQVRKMEECLSAGIGHLSDAKIDVYVQNLGPSHKSDGDEDGESAGVPAIIEVLERVEDERLNFEGGHDRAFNATPPHHADSISQPVLRTPVTTEISNSHDVSVFDYASHNPSLTATPDQKRTTVGHYDAWSTPTSGQNIFSPVDHSAPPSGQGLLPPSMFPTCP
ncbi:hypothetical protein N7539_008572 [Penicillium diatomitis]|uniref:Uncharacterized protein n=1 Tax=Penicillium diatomitis TaxID=2819901 RepID=A0A9X0BLX1_9EURO|nr:uncharacterized protein N7539_008791 [Penicillium diatomitis]XP_056786549.1 uncharacterized protein N7539_008572 [Penicillium diatomitis]KAJ5471848.1 hypothetical protein N7539_008791 [Penicillium diatomitis]KAJ5472003.1 hypothetical protein N7539_008572 [Penicillium diatomitis]